MNTYVAFLRAINVPGHAKIKMNCIRQVFTGAGCRNVRTHIQTGNIIFEIHDKNKDTINRHIQDELSRLLGEEATVIFRTHTEIANIVHSSPFKNIGKGADTKLYVAFLSRKPPIKPKLPILSDKEALTVFKMKKLEVFIISRKKNNGFFGIPNNFIEKEFGIPATTRNWSTISKIAELISERT